MNFNMSETSTVVDQDYKVTVVKFGKKDALKDNCDKLLDIGLMTMKVWSSKTFFMCLQTVIAYNIGTKLQVYV